MCVRERESSRHYSAGFGISVVHTHSQRFEYVSPGGIYSTELYSATLRVGAIVQCWTSASGRTARTIRPPPCRVLLDIPPRKYLWNKMGKITPEICFSSSRSVVCEIGKVLQRGPHEGLVKVEVKGERRSKSSVFFTYRVRHKSYPACITSLIEQVVLFNPLRHVSLHLHKIKLNQFK